MNKFLTLYIVKFIQHVSLYTKLLITNYLEVDITEVIKK